MTFRYLFRFETAATPALIWTRTRWWNVKHAGVVHSVTTCWNAPRLNYGRDKDFHIGPFSVWQISELLLFSFFLWHDWLKRKRYLTCIFRPELQMWGYLTKKKTMFRPCFPVSFFGTTLRRRRWRKAKTSKQQRCAPQDLLVCFDPLFRE